jgi:hypothetical protein
LGDQSWNIVIDGGKDVAGSLAGNVGHLKKLKKKKPLEPIGWRHGVIGMNLKRKITYLEREERNDGFENGKMDLHCERRGGTAEESDGGEDRDEGVA